MKTKNLVIRASAGTGKTFALATRFLQLALFNKVPPERIVALTFSRNAAQEIYVKILERLWKAAADDDSAAKETETLLEKLSGGERAGISQTFDGSKETYGRLLRAVVGVQDAGAIATLDSFILRVVRSFPLETGFDEVPDVLDGFGEKRVAADAFSAILSGAETESGLFKETFGKAQKGANARTIASTLEKLLGPWSGFLASHPEARKWSASQMGSSLCVAGTMPDLSAVPVSGSSRDPRTNCVKFLQKDRTKMADALPGGKTAELIRFLLDNPDKTVFRYTTETGQVKEFDCGAAGAEALRSGFRVAAGWIVEDGLKETEAKLGLAAIVADARAATKRRLGKFAFEDFTVALAESETAGRNIALQDVQFRLDSMFDHWELDEFQDTSEAQWKCLKRLVEEASSDVEGAAPDANGRSATVVGDLKQSIYTWRGGNDRPFQEIMEWRQFSGEYGENISLPESHRYGRNTVDFVNAVFGPDNVHAHEADCHAAAERWLAEDCWMTHRPPRKDNDDFIEIIGVDPEDDEEAADDPENDENDAVAQEDDDGGTAAVRALAPQICDFVVDFWKKHGGSTDTVGILVRGNADGALLAERLRSLGVPVVWEGLSGVLDSPVVRAVLDLLSLAHHPEDVFAWKTVNDIFPLREAVFPYLVDAPSVSAAVSRMLARLGLARTLREIVAKLAETGLNEWTKGELDALVREGAAFESRPEAGGDLTRFRDWLAAAAGREIATSPDVLRILTIHRAKGLTLDHVIVPIPEMDSPKNGIGPSIVKPKPARTILSGNGWALGGFAGENMALVRELVPALKKAWDNAAGDCFLEALRTYYVALTRARKSTHVFLVDQPRKAGVQFRDLLLAPWKDRSPVRTEPWGKVLFESGTMPPFKMKKDDGTDKSASGNPWPFVPVETHIEHVTPSALFHGAGPDAGFPADLPFAENAGAAAGKGVDEHAEFAKIEWIDPVTPEGDRERKILEWGGAWSEAFRKTPGATVWREKGYEVFSSEGKFWETGQFDRVVFRGSGSDRTAEIYDFKTNAKRTGESVGDFERRMASTYGMQMNAYRRAVAVLCDLPFSRISATLLLSATGTAVEIPPPTNHRLWADEDLGPCSVPVRLDRPSSPANPWDPHETYNTQS